MPKLKDIASTSLTSITEIIAKKSAEEPKIENKQQWYNELILKLNTC